MKRLFGTDGIRGEAGAFPLNEATVRVVGRSLARHLASRSTTGRGVRIITGRDTRESGSWIERALIQGAVEAGAQYESAGVITTPGVAYLARSRGADAGVVISASHNPYRDNGIKIFAPSGRKLDDAAERLIEADVAAENLGDALSTSSSSATEERDTSSNLEPVGESQSVSDLQASYIDHLFTDIAGGLDLNGLHIVIDCANGAASHLAPPLFQRMGARVTAINNTPNGRNINLDCGSQHIEGLQARVKVESADFGVAFDGDADRALFVDEHGQSVDGDATLWVMANYLQTHGHLADNTVVATTMSNLGLELALRDRGIRLVRTDVGDKYVLEELLRTDASIGGEQSGHLIFPRLSLAGDGMLTTISLLRALQDSKASLSELVTGFRRYPQILLNVPVGEKKPFAEVDAIQQASLEIEQLLGDKGRLLLRYSGTEPLARVMIEGEQQRVIDEYANQLAAVIRDELGTS
jgi:phosphoglucosamine mutase